MKESADQWYEDVMKRYEDAEQVALLAQERAEEYWRDVDMLSTALENFIVDRDTAIQLSVMRDLAGRDDHHSRAILQACCIKLLDVFEREVDAFILDNEDFDSDS